MAKKKSKMRVINPPSKSCVKKILKKMNGVGFKWVYLGEDISKAVLLDEMLGNKGEKLEIARALQETAKSLRQPYIDYIGRLSLKRGSLKWWAGRLSEKNPVVSKTFLHACYIKVCEDILKKYPNENLVFFVEKGATRRAMLKNLRTEGIHHIGGRGASISDALKDAKKIILYKGWFLLSNIYRIIISKYAYRMHKRVDSHYPLVLIHTWVGRGSFDRDGTWRELYFGALPDYLKKNGKNVAIVPYVTSVVPYKKTIDNMSKSESVFLVPHAFLSVSDIFRTFFFTLVNVPKKTVFPKLENMDISEIIKEDLKSDWIEGRAASDMLFYHLVKRWKENQLLIDTVIYTYENHTWEKVFCTALRKFYSSTYLIGYQHAVPSRMFLNYFFSKHESKIVPLPDRIVTSGNYSNDALIKSGYPREKAVLGGAVRYAYLLEQKMEVKRKSKGKPVILVAPTILESAVELIKKTFDAFEHRSEYRIIIKCHPFAPFEMVSKYLNIKFPRHFTVSNIPIPELLKESDVLLYTSSTASIEAIAAGIPVVYVGSDLSIDLDPLDTHPKARASARNAGEIAKCVEEAVSMNKWELSKKRKIWNRVVKDLFGRVDDSIYRLFLR